MGAHWIPPRDPNEVRLEQIRGVIAEVLQSHIAGRGKETKIKKASDDIIAALRPLLKLASEPTKGATVMTEAASMRNAKKGPSNL